MTTPITIAGATGLTGTQALVHLLNSKSPFSITALTRRQLSNPVPTSPSTFTNNVYPTLTDAVKAEVGHPGGVYISCLGSTRAGAGGVKEQEKIDLVLNRDLATKAKQDGSDTMILVSTGMADPKAYSAYLKMKGQLEEDVKGLGFKNTIILQPGLLLGSRNETRTAEYALQVFFRGLRSIGIPVLKFAIEAEDIGACIAQLASAPPAGLSLLDDYKIMEYSNAWKAANAS